MQESDSYKRVKNLAHTIDNHGENVYRKPIYGLNSKKKKKWNVSGKSDIKLIT